MNAADLLAVILLFSLLLYVVLGGADFGGGFWDLAASGPRRKKQRELVDKAIAPVWEANHVWLILALVLLFTGFPAAFTRLAVVLHLPLTLLLLGIVLRGSAFVFRHYGGGTSNQAWGRLFAVTSTISPFFLGVLVGAVSTDTPEIWLTPFTICTGFFAVALVAFLAAVYLTLETNDRALREDFRRRALLAQAVVALLAFAAGRLGKAPPWSVQVPTAAFAAAAVWFLWKRNFTRARVASVGQVAGIVLGWGWVQYPYLAPPLTIQTAAAPPATLRWLLAALAVGSVVLFPSLYWLMRIFKSRD